MEVALPGNSSQEEEEGKVAPLCVEMRRQIAEPVRGLKVDAADVFVVQGEREREKLRRERKLTPIYGMPSLLLCCSYQSESDEDELEDVGVGDRDESAQEGVEDGDGRAHHDRNLDVQPQDHLQSAA